MINFPRELPPVILSELSLVTIFNARNGGRARDPKLAEYVNAYIKELFKSTFYFATSLLLAGYTFTTFHKRTNPHHLFLPAFTSTLIFGLRLAYVFKNSRAVKQIVESKEHSTLQTTLEKIQPKALQSYSSYGINPILFKLFYEYDCDPKLLSDDEIAALNKLLVDLSGVNGPIIFDSNSEESLYPIKQTACTFQGLKYLCTFLQSHYSDMLPLMAGEQWTELDLRHITNVFESKNDLSMLFHPTLLEKEKYPLYEICNYLYEMYNKLFTDPSERSFIDDLINYHDDLLLAEKESDSLFKQEIQNKFMHLSKFIQKLRQHVFNFNLLERMAAFLEIKDFGDEYTTSIRLQKAPLIGFNHMGFLLPGNYIYGLDFGVYKRPLSVSDPNEIRFKLHLPLPEQMPTDLKIRLKAIFFREINRLTKSELQWEGLKVRKIQGCSHVNASYFPLPFLCNYFLYFFGNRCSKPQWDPETYDMNTQKEMFCSEFVYHIIHKALQEVNKTLRSEGHDAIPYPADQYENMETLTPYRVYKLLKTGKFIHTGALR